MDTTIGPKLAHQFFINNMVEKINKEFKEVDTSMMNVRVFLGKTDNISEKTKNILKNHYENDGWNALFERGGSLLFIILSPLARDN